MEYKKINNKNTDSTEMPKYEYSSVTNNEFVDYPYLGIGQKPKSNTTLTDDKLENLIY